ncbi:MULTISPECIES: hypothetical protein [Aeribacillus]|jgi:hypothetical protein|uniref:hypothetical protein n=1 Tax=Aeribacillus TaxID=1055323 RepID=UPI000ADF9ADA|nr:MULTISPECIES: hypothetical protein [Aeribacillus]MED0650975.1 hypothetical protein [Aeribacillus composti]MED1443661.1 hypothetical protein [Aeribacillus composti]MED4488143.1 hypothetical protein [Aeribacillus pallidus]TVZ76350.1 hypothetical protein FB379_13931 [Aeribacillus composti]BBU39511.1 hypothetical protein APP_18030 [Aeribacillus pallidus]
MPPIYIQNRRHKYLGAHQKETILLDPPIEDQSYSEKTTIEVIANTAEIVC